MSLLNFSRFVACFVDAKGEYVGKKVFRRTLGSLGHSDKIFNYDGGTYNILPSRASRLELSFTTHIFFDNYIYVYKVGNPDPISFKLGSFAPIMDADIYKERLESKLVKDLNSVAKGGFDINWRYVLIVIAIFGVVYYFMNGGDFTTQLLPFLLIKSKNIFNDISSN